MTLEIREGWHTQICNFRCLITSVLQICMGRDFINAVAAHWLDGKCQRLLATALKVQHCWTLKLQSATVDDSRPLALYKHTRDCRRLSLSRGTVSDCRWLKYKPGLCLSHFTLPGPVRAVPELFWTKIVRPLTGPARTPCGAVRILPPRTGPVEF